MNFNAQKAAYTDSAAYAAQATQLGGAPERGQLESAGDSIACSISELGCAIDQMEARLSSVLQPSAPQPAGANATQGAGIPISPAVAYLVEQRRRVDSLVARVNEMRSRLDT